MKLLNHAGFADASCENSEVRQVAGVLRKGKCRPVTAFGIFNLNLFYFSHVPRLHHAQTSRPASAEDSW